MRAPVFVGALALVLAGQAAAQEGNWYRQGVPAVMEPASAAPDGVAASFAEAYRSRGQPRILVFWMRPLSDRPSSERRRIERTEEAAVIGGLAADGAVSAGGRHARAAESYSAAIGAGYGVRTHEEWEGFVSGEEARDPLAPAVSREAESAFLRELARAGGRVVDRAVAVRMSEAPSGDPLAAETAALASKADLLIEVGAVADAGKAGGLSYRIDIRSLPDGMIVTSFTTDAEPRPGADVDFAAAPGLGYVEKPGPGLGQELAWQAMENMARVWRR